MDNYKAVNEEIAKLLVELKNYNPMEDEYRTIAQRITDTKARRAWFEMWEDLYGDKDDDYTYTRKTEKESE